MNLIKFYDDVTNPKYPFCIEIIDGDDVFSEVMECLWFATEAEQLEEFDKLTD